MSKRERERDSDNTDKILSEREAESANQWLIEFMKGVLHDGKFEVAKLQYGLRRTYWIVIILSIVMFILGTGLILASVVKAWSDSELWRSLAIGGLGLADLTGLYLFRPVEQIRKIMADMSQLTIAINSYQTQVSLRLLQLDSSKRPTIGQAAEQIKKAARSSMRNIEKYFEEGSPAPIPEPKPQEDAEPEQPSDLPEPADTEPDESAPKPPDENAPSDSDEESRELKLAKNVLDYLDNRVRQERAAEEKKQSEGKSDS
ncbi:MAG: hypothetical protein ACT4NX_10225 [Deltaproteobacteria bacterium]